MLLPLSGVLGLAVALVVVGSPWWPDDGGRAEPSSAAPQVLAPQAADLTTAVAAIGRARAEAFATASTQPLAAADEPGSPAMAYDAALVRGLAERGWRLAGVGYAVRDVRVVDHAAGAATVTASVTTSAHRRVSAGGAVVAQVAAEEPRPVTLTLVEVPGAGWRVRAVS